MHKVKAFILQILSRISLLLHITVQFKVGNSDEKEEQDEQNE